MKLAHTVRNDQAAELEVWVEPWCHTYKVPFGSVLTFHFEAASAKAAELYIVTTPERLVIYFSTDFDPSADLDGEPVQPLWE